MYIDFVFIFIIGLCIGSFLNVCLVRLEKGENIVYPRSHCDRCGHILKWYENIPVISYVALRGKCIECKEQIGAQHLIVELLAGIVTLGVYIRVGGDFYTTFSVLFLLVNLCIIAYLDYKTMAVSEIHVLTVAIFGFVNIVLVMYTKIPNIAHIKSQQGFYVSLIAIGLLALLAVITKGIGFVDIEIYIILTAYLSYNEVSVVLMLSTVLAGIYGFYLVYFKKKSRKTEIPFMPYIFVATLVSVFYGNEIVETYLRLIG